MLNASNTACFGMNMAMTCGHVVGVQYVAREKPVKFPLLSHDEQSMVYGNLP